MLAADFDLRRTSQYSACSLTGRASVKPRPCRNATSCSTSGTLCRSFEQAVRHNHTCDPRWTRGHQHCTEPKSDDKYQMGCRALFLNGRLSVLVGMCHIWKRTSYRGNVPCPYLPLVSLLSLTMLAPTRETTKCCTETIFSIISFVTS